MQKTDYAGEALFRIIKVIEQGSVKWNKTLYYQWRNALLYMVVLFWFVFGRECYKTEINR